MLSGFIRPNVDQPDFGLSRKEPELCGSRVGKSGRPCGVAYLMGQITVVAEMAVTLEKLYLDKDSRNKLGSAARKRAEEFYVYDKLGQRMQYIYQFALDTTRS